jgi:hypothetical protein
LRPQASEGEAQHGPFCWTRRFGQGNPRSGSPRRAPQTGVRHTSNRSRACRNGNWKMASRDWRRKAISPHLKFQNLPARDSGAPANPRECRRFSDSRILHRRDWTGWLGWEDSNSRMRLQNWPLKCGPNFPSLRNVWRSVTSPAELTKSDLHPNPVHSAMNMARRPPLHCGQAMLERRLFGLERSNPPAPASVSSPLPTVAVPLTKPLGSTTATRRKPPPPLDTENPLAIPPAETIAVPPVPWLLLA